MFIVRAACRRLHGAGELVELDPTPAQTLEDSFISACLFPMFLPLGSTGRRKEVGYGASRDLVMDREPCRGRSPRGRAGRLPQPPRALDRAISGRRTDRHAVAHLR